MKIKEICYTSHFERAFRKLSETIQKRALEQESIFRENCFAPQLKTHKLKGVLEEFWSFSVDYSHRITFAFEKGGTVTFTDIGNHSVYQ